MKSNSEIKRNLMRKSLFHKMPPAMCVRCNVGNHTGVCICCFSVTALQRVKCFYGNGLVFQAGDPNYDPYGPSNDFEANENVYTTKTAPPSSKPQESERDRVLSFVAFRVLLPIVAILIAICLVLGIILIVKSYMMAPLKQNLANAIRRRRRVGKAPDNNYVLAEEMRASQQRSSSISDRKSLPPPEVILAARERMSQMLNV